MTSGGTCGSGLYMILLEDLVSRTVISASSLIVNSVGLPMFIGPI